jgi:predicted DNA-binding transcriptional regulator YafY
MNAKLQRLKKIRSFLRSQSGPRTVTEIHDALVNRLGEDVSRKTIERDVDELIESRSVIVMQGLPARIQLTEIEQIEVTLTTQEIKSLIQLLGDDSEISQKLKKALQSF